MSEHTTTIHQRPRPGGSAPLAGRTVARIGYGAMQLERLHDEPARATELLHRAVEMGVDHIDTAQFYGHGFVNGLIREVLRTESDLVVATKVGSDPHTGGPFPMRAAQRPEQLRASVQENLRALGLEQVPLVNLRRMDVGPAVPLSPDQVVDVEDQLAEMTALRDEGLIGAIGLSSISAEVLRRALPAGIACVQNAYSLVDRSDEALLELCRAENIAWVPYFPLGSAFPGLPKVTDEPEVASAATALGATTSQVGLAWLLQHSENTLLIPGTTSVEHLQANLAAGDVHLPAHLVNALERIPPRRPTQHA